MTLNEWIISGETGISSKTMWAAISGVIKEWKYKKHPFDVPYDKDDFGRCYKFYKECNLNKTHLLEVKRVFNWWSPFIDNWDLLCQMYECNQPMFDYIQKLERESKLLGGWVETSKGFWSLNEDN